MTCAIQRTSSPLPVIPCEGSNAAGQAEGAAPPEVLLPAPFEALATSNDIGAQLTALIVKTSHQQKAIARESRRSAEHAQRDAEDHQLDAMRDQADAKFAAGLLEGATKVGSGASGLGTTGGSDACKAYGKASSSMGDGMSEIAGALYKREADLDGVDAKDAEQSADRAGRAAKDAREVETDAKEMLDRALGYYKEYLTAKSETQRATLLRA
jgi:hypothetical protein